MNFVVLFAFFFATQVNARSFSVLAGHKMQTYGDVLFMVGGRFADGTANGIVRINLSEVQNKRLSEMTEVVPPLPIFQESCAFVNRTDVKQVVCLQHDLSSDSTLHWINLDTAEIREEKVAGEFFLAFFITPAHSSSTKPSEKGSHHSNERLHLWDWGQPHVCLQYVDRKRRYYGIFWQRASRNSKCYLHR
jgi:hypothetical protein